jgi:hypothetical protein
MWVIESFTERLPIVAESYLRRTIAGESGSLLGNNRYQSQGQTDGPPAKSWQSSLPSATV